MDEKLMFNKDGSTKEAPKWMRPDRCGTCAHWSLLPKEQQFPGPCETYGRCSKRRGFRTRQIEHCERYKAKNEGRGGEK